MIKKQWIPAIIFFIAIFSLAPAVKGEDLPGPVEIMPPAAESMPGASPAVPMPAVPSPAADTRDPFASDFETDVPAVSVVSEMGAPTVEVKLEGVGISHDGAFAIINGEVIPEGETKGGINVVQVRKQEVDIVANGAPQTLKLVLEAEVERMNQRRIQKTKKKPMPVQVSV